MPWALCRGDILENLEDLKEEEEPEEAVTKQLWQMLHAGVPMPRLVAIVKLLGQVPWTTIPASNSVGVWPYQTVAPRVWVVTSGWQ
eukprot:9942734-Lingulodinium_polyedra.AAC.1